MEYSDLEGNIIRILRIENGKVVRGYIVRPNAKKNLASISSTCTTTCYDSYEYQCYGYTDSEGQYVELGCENTSIGTDCNTYCVDDGDNGTEPCPSGDCNGSGGGGSGSGSSGTATTKDPSVTNHQKTDCIVSKLTSEDSFAKKVFLKNFLNSSAYNVTFKRADEIPSLPGHTPNASAVSDPNTKTVSIYIRTSYVENMPALPDPVRIVISGNQL